MTPEELAAIRERVERHAMSYKQNLTMQDRAALLAEVDRLQATIRRVEALRDEMWGQTRDQIATVWFMADVLAAALNGDDHELA